MPINEVRFLTDNLTIARPRNPPSVKPRAVIYCHQAGGSYQDGFGVGSEFQQYLIQPLVDRGGRTVYVPDCGGVGTFGNDTAIAAVETARLAAVADGFPAKVHLMAASMGGLLALNYAARNASKVASIFLCEPGTDLAAMYASGFSFFIDPAYTDNAGYLAALPTHSPMLQLTAWMGIPIALCYSASDTTITQASYAAFIKAVNPVIWDGGTLGHSAHKALPSADLVNWFVQHEGS